ncbi:MAG: VWA domain-containing protein [Paracoccaceae bacterium]
MEIDTNQRTNLAFWLATVNPALFGGVILTGVSAAHSEIVLNFFKNSNLSLNKIFSSFSTSDLNGGIDPLESLHKGVLVYRQGILSRSGWFLCPSSNEMPQALQVTLADQMDSGKLAPLILLDDGHKQDETNNTKLKDRVAISIDLTDVRYNEFCLDFDTKQNVKTVKAEINDVQIQSVIITALKFGIENIRPVYMTVCAAQYLAGINDRKRVEQEDLNLAASLILAHRALLIPEEIQNDAENQPPKEQEETANKETNQENNASLPTEILIEAIKASLPNSVFEQLRSNLRQKTKSGSGFGNRQKSKVRGRPKPSRNSPPGDQERVDVVATLRSAAPWQKLRKKQFKIAKNIIIFPSDIHTFNFEDRSERVIIFLVDASGSAAMNRLGESKGAIELMLADSYAKRDFVSLISFRDTSAEILLPPTRSLVQTKKRLSALMAGGGTPLATGLDAGIKLAQTCQRSGKMPSLAVLTDGKANIDLDGNPNREKAFSDSILVAKVGKKLDMKSVFIDCGKRANSNLNDLATSMGANYVCLPRTNANNISNLVKANLGV